jgi:Domain of unknown function (DUF5060)
MCHLCEFILIVGIVVNRLDLVNGQIPSPNSFTGTFTIVKAGITNASSFGDVSLGTHATGSTVDITPFNNIPLSLVVNYQCCFTSVQLLYLSSTSTFTQKQGSAPYALKGNSGHNYNTASDLNIAGNKRITAVGNSGTVPITSLNITFNIMRSLPVPSAPVTVTPIVVPVPAPLPATPITVPPSIPLPATPITVPVPVSKPVPVNVPPSESTDVKAYNHSDNGSTTGELRRWHKITIGFNGPTTTESSNPNPFTQYRLDVTFTHVSSNKKLVIPGYYAADGNAANTGATSGKVWLVHFVPSLVGIWNWVASFQTGTNVAQNGGGTTAGFFDRATGTLVINETNKSGRDLRGKGLLEYVGEHYLQFAGTGEYFLKAGADSPENFLAYADFDNTPNNRNYRKTWQPHEQDYVSMKDTTWMNGKGKGMIGAINYLSSRGMNVFSFLTMNIDGDDRNVFPYVATTDLQRIDVSKTAQWEVVFDHADRMGMFLHFKMQEQENDQLLDNGALGINRKLYYRELIARFGHHLALNWNLGEETSNTDLELKSYCDYFKANDPYNHLIVVQTRGGSNQDEVYGKFGIWCML